MRGRKPDGARLQALKGNPGKRLSRKRTAQELAAARRIREQRKFIDAISAPTKKDLPT
jgi:hypothetical protein